MSGTTADDTADDDERLEADDRGEPGGEDLLERPLGTERDAKAATDDGREHNQHHGGADQTELLADRGEDEVVLDLGASVGLPSPRPVRRCRRSTTRTSPARSDSRGPRTAATVEANHHSTRSRTGARRCRPRRRRARHDREEAVESVATHSITTNGAKNSSDTPRSRRPTITMTEKPQASR